MSTKLSLKAALARRDEIPAERHGLSTSHPFRLLISGAVLDRPIDVARFLKAHGLSLRKAHQILDRLVRGERVAVELNADDGARLVDDLSNLGVRGEVISTPQVDPREVRESLRLSQSEFAIHFGIGLDTIQNWEQKRYTPDASAQLLLNIIKAHSHTVDRVLTSSNRNPKLRLHMELQVRNHAWLVVATPSK